MRRIRANEEAPRVVGIFRFRETNAIGGRIGAKLYPTGPNRPGQFRLDWVDPNLCNFSYLTKSSSGKFKRKHTT